MKDYKKKNAEQWCSQTWKREIAAIKGEGAPKEIRDSAFISLRKRVKGYYKLVARKYTRLLSLEGDQVNEFLDYILYKSVLQYVEAKGTFFGYFASAVENSIKMIKRARKRRIDRGFELHSLDHLQELHENHSALADTREVEHDLIAEIKKKGKLSPIQRRVLDLKAEGYNEYEIGKITFMNWLQVRRSVRNIRIAAEFATEV